MTDDGANVPPAAARGLGADAIMRRCYTSTS
jgi:hypothetical protein